MFGVPQVSPAAEANESLEFSRHLRDVLRDEKVWNGIHVLPDYKLQLPKTIDFLHTLFYYLPYKSLLFLFLIFLLLRITNHTENQRTKVQT